ncbi:MAG: nucleotidyl transferase AbiEii/AbiGii toxin family protein [Candidatus Omnitrophica bacterium]|nr:nucleotidyl transferase AbiEii/AbiGii toxin family protein [Candidatus Omnitrophota bacterium]MCB9783445.1 nucleotidyl transferase AbiEii/AbiGii toxin family protein [Candidatus Omnitrophota bacterium]
MIPRDYITEWRAKAPWVYDFQIEQDLILSRALVAIFSESLRFRGGCALYKLHLPSSARYSEDIDLVQMQSGPAGQILEALRDVLDGWLGRPQWKQTEGGITFTYRFESEDSPPVPLRLKIEINTREHFEVHGTTQIPYSVESRWFRGACRIGTYEFNEILATKLRALFQRKKGRDLFDLATALSDPRADPEKIVDAFLQYMAHSRNPITRARFEENLKSKIQDLQFAADLGPLLASGYSWNIEKAASVIFDRILCHLPGEPWKGESSD